MRDEHSSAAMIVAFNPQTFPIIQSCIQLIDARFDLGKHIDLVEVILLKLQLYKARSASTVPDNLILW